MGNSGWWDRFGFMFLVCAATVAAPAQSFTKLLDFNFFGNSANPEAVSLVQGTDGNLYGTTYGYNPGDNPHYGTVFDITPAGALTTLWTFCAEPDCADGEGPRGALVQATNGGFYGTTVYGGSSSYGYGTIFRLTSAGALATLHVFEETDGSNPYAGLVQASDGNFYGTTLGGGTDGYGTVFKVTPNGTLTTLHSFYPHTGSNDGRSPWAGLVQGRDGDLYGTTVNGGTGDDGTVFKITLGGKLTTLHSFNFTDGYGPYGGVIQASDGNFYGTTIGAADDSGGTVFKMTPAGDLTTLYNFGTQVYAPMAPLVEGTDGNFYGTSNVGGANNVGTIFKISQEGVLTTLYSFDFSDGANPDGGLIQSTDGSFYGTVLGGGDPFCHGGCGTIFRLSVGLGPFVKTIPAYGKVGSAVKILGTNLSAASSVTFDGTVAGFTIVSPSLITTAVPASATTGTVQVVAPNGTLSSNAPFRVLP
jgi:uncharacterized repeat protein (TIGR03803 family)